MLDRDGWRECAEMMDVRVWVECEREVCRRRTITRNLAAGIVDSLEKCEERGRSLSPILTSLPDLIPTRHKWISTRIYADAETLVDASDVVNGDEVADHKYKPTEIIHCIESPELAKGN